LTPSNGAENKAYCLHLTAFRGYVTEGGSHCFCASCLMCGFCLWVSMWSNVKLICQHVYYVMHIGQTRLLRPVMKQHW